MKDYDENKESYLKYLDVSNVYSWDEWMSQKLSANDFKRDEKTSEYNEDFIKSYNDKIN